VALWAVRHDVCILEKKIFAMESSFSTTTSTVQQLGRGSRHSRPALIGRGGRSRTLYCLCFQHDVLDGEIGNNQQSRCNSFFSTSCRETCRDSVNPKQ